MKKPAKLYLERIGMIKLKNILNEDRFDQSKMFNNSTVKKIADEIKKMVKFKGDSRLNFSYTEHRFASGDGGFSFKWNHSKNWGGQIGINIDDTKSNHSYYNYSYYGNSKTGIFRFMKPFKFKGDPAEWKDFNNDHLLAFWKKMKPMIKKNEAASKAALDAEAKAQSDYYGKKSDTGRIGYGLSSQPRR